MRPHELIAKYAWVRERCACGTTIEAETRMDTDVLLAVRLHNRTPQHQAWRRAQVAYNHPVGGDADLGGAEDGGPKPPSRPLRSTWEST